jgi:hypothetical protein
MQNYSQIFAETLAEFESPLVPADQGDNGKGQVTCRAGYRINTTMNGNVGFIGKNPGQTQFAGVAVDALMDKSDATGADYLTDVDAGGGMREIRLAYTAYAPPPPGTPLPPSNWVQPTMDHVNTPGPLTLKADAPVPGPEPEPEPQPPVDQEQLNRIEAKIDALQEAMVNGFQEVIATDNMNTQRIQEQIHQVVEDAEESLKKIAPILIGMLRAADDDGSGMGPIDQWLAGLGKKERV